MTSLKSTEDKASIQVEMIIAECPHCKARRYSWSKEDAIYQLSQHRCLDTLSDEEFEMMFNRVLGALKK